MCLASRSFHFLIEALWLLGRARSSSQRTLGREKRLLESSEGHAGMRKQNTNIIKLYNKFDSTASKAHTREIAGRCNGFPAPERHKLRSRPGWKGGAVASQDPPKPEVLSLIEMCRWELERLRGVAADYKAYNSACRDHLALAKESLKQRPGNDTTQAARLTLDGPATCQSAAADPSILKVCRDRAEEHRAFADRASDPGVRILLLELAVGYEKIAKRE
jgi:hypothetical protein